jgi:hypothetical protein
VLIPSNLLILIEAKRAKKAPLPDDGYNLGTVISAGYGDEIAKAVEFASSSLLTGTRVGS